MVEVNPTQVLTLEQISIRLAAQDAKIAEQAQEIAELKLALCLCQKKDIQTLKGQSWRRDFITKENKRPDLKEWAEGLT